MARALTRFCLLAMSVGWGWAAELRDLRSVEPDLTVPDVTDGDPAPGKRVRQVAPEYAGTQVYHVLYLPSDWQPGRRYPLLVEYAGNGPYQNQYGDVSTGEVEGSKLGYGISAGKGFIWLCLPYVNRAEGKNQRQWWGDVAATVAYAKTAVRRVCEHYGGDPSAVLLAGFSRGAIACNYLGLHDDEIADIWLAFIPYSHYDGVRRWGYADDDRPAALRRLERLRGRASFVCHEGSVEPTRQYLETTGIAAPFTFRSLGFHNHNDAWTLRESDDRRALRAWVEDVLRRRPGTYRVAGRVTDAQGRPLAGVRVESGPTHFAATDAEGRYELAGLVAGLRRLTAIDPQNGKSSAQRQIEVRDRDLSEVDLAGDSRSEPPASAGG